MSREVIINIVIVIIMASITSTLLFVIYLTLEKHPTTKEALKRRTTIVKRFTICSGTTIVVMGTFVLNSLLRLKYNNPNTIQNKILSTGIFIVCLMLLLSSIFRYFYKKVFAEDHNKYYKNFVLINYLVVSILVIILSFVYIKDWTLALTWLVVFLGKFIWFDGFSQSIKIPEKKKIIQMIVFDLLIACVFLLTLYLCEITNWDRLMFMFAGFDFGMFIVGIIIVIREKKKLRETVL